MYYATGKITFSDVTPRPTVEIPHVLSQMEILASNLLGAYMEVRKRSLEETCSGRIVEYK